MDEVKIKTQIKEIILGGYPAYIKVPSQEKSVLFALCIDPNELDWLFEQKLIDKIIRYVISDADGDALALAKEIKNALGDYYETHLESMYEDCLAEIEQDRREEAGLKRNVDPINGEVTWSR